MIKKHTILPLAALMTLAFTVGCNGGSGGGSGEILATVEGEPITIDQFNSYLAVKPTARVLVQGQVAELPVSDTLAFQAMQDLVSRTIMFQMAKDENVLPTSDEINNEIKFQEKLDPRFMDAYKARGMILAQIRDEVKFSLVQERLITKGITVSNDEVDAWLQQNPNAFIVPAKASLSWILAQSDARKAQVDAALKSGERFSEAAVKFSQAPSAQMVNGRYLPERGPIPIAAMAPNLRALIEKANVGQSTDWIKFSEGWAKFYVDNKEDQKKLEITAERRTNIQRNLALQRGNKANDLRKRMVERVRSTDVVVRRDSLKDAWKNFSEMLKKQAEQTTAAQGTNSPAPTGTQDVSKG